MSTIELKQIGKKYDNSERYSVENFNLYIEEKEFIVLVGPSGCGKSTTLRMIAGLEYISEGDLFINGTRMNEVESKNRDISMVFQNYALYPHMSVFENMAFGLKVRKMAKAEIYKRVEEAAEILGLTDLLKRKPKELSGGQRQRVALGRAIVRHSGVFLMDEPLSNLDAKLRVQMRAEITRLHRQLGTTTIYVTHDQTEAMTMATRIVIMKDGHIQQIGKPIDVYRNPVNLFVASFIGSPGMNFISGELANQQYIIGAGKAIHQLSEHDQEKMERNNRRPVIMGIRPEHVTIQKEKTSFPVTIDLIETIGSEMLVHTKVANKKIIIKTQTDDTYQVGMHIYLSFSEGNIHWFDKENENSLV